MAIKISTPQDLDNIRNNLTGDYELANDIDMSGYDWTPIAPDASNRFTGKIDGKGYKIKNLTIDDTNTNVGFVGWSNSPATFKNLGFENVVANINQYSSIFVARAQNTVFENCFLQGEIKGVNHIGGFSYSTSRCTFNNCYVDITISGLNTGAFVTVDSNNSFFTNCYSKANTVFIERPNTNNNYKTVFTKSYFNKSLYNGKNLDGLIGLTDQQMQTQSNFIGWDFNNVWYMEDYPKLRVFTNIPVVKKETITVNSYTNPLQANLSKSIQATKSLQANLSRIYTVNNKQNGLTPEFWTISLLI